MRCERAVTLLATGGILGRWRARRHASRCPVCAAEAVRLRRIARELSIVRPLSATQRACGHRSARIRGHRRPGRPDLARPCSPRPRRRSSSPLVSA